MIKNRAVSPDGINQGGVDQDRASSAEVERAGYLPGLNAADVEWDTLVFERGGSPLTIAVPVLSAQQMADLAVRVGEARRRYLQPLSIARITDIIDAAVARLLDRQDPYRRKADALLPTITGFDAGMVHLGLTEYLKTFRKPELTRFIAEDFSNPQMLDGFQPATKGGFTRAHGPDILAHIWAGNVPGLPLWSLVCGLLVKAGNIGKVPSAEPLFAGWFAQLVTEIEPDLAACFAVVWWRGGDLRAERELFKKADVILAYGGNDSLEAIGQRVPITTRYLPYGHKISFAMVGREALDPQKAWAVAHQAAYDIMRYDQQGCYSPQVLFVERGAKITPLEFSRYLANELASFERRFPRRALTIDEARDVAAWRYAEEMKCLAQPDREMTGDVAGAWTVVYANEAEDLAPSGLNRTIRIVAVDTLSDAVPLVAPHKAFLQTVAIATSPVRLFELAERLGQVGVTRICALGRMTAPEAGWHHDGRFNLLDLVTVTEIEHSAADRADAFAPYVD